MNKLTKITTGLGLVAVTTVGAASFAFANGPNGNVAARPFGPDDGLADKIATTYNLDSTAVQQTIDQYHLEQVNGGTLTAEQQQLLTDKLAKVQARRTEIASIADATERHTQMLRLRDEIEQWESDNNLTLPGGPRGEAGPGGHHGAGRDMMDDDDAEASQ